MKRMRGVRRARVVTAALMVSIAQAATAQSLLERHRHAVQTGDTEQVSLRGVIVGRPGGNEIRLNISPAALVSQRLYSLDIVQLVAGGQVLPVRIVRASIAPFFLQDSNGAASDSDSVAALIVDDDGVGAETTLVGYGTAIADGLGAYAGMPVQIQAKRYRLP